MKKITIFSLKAFIGPFFVTFIVSVFLLVMQFFWKYIDDMMGKGLGVDVILRLMFYVSASLVPLALPLAVLLSSIITLGNLSESNELTALKSSGSSLFKILRPLLFTMIIISLFTFYFTNYILPIANLKWRAIIYDIQQTKIAEVVKEGVFNKDFDNFAIKVNKKKDNLLEGILIYDYSIPSKIKIIRSEKGEIRQSDDGNFLFFTLNNGSMYEEVKTNKTNSYYPFQKSYFNSIRLKFSLEDFKLGQSDENLFKSYKMMNVFQLYNEVDSTIRQKKEMRIQFKNGIKRQMHSLNSLSYLPKNKKDTLENQFLIKKNNEFLDSVFLLDNLSNSERTISLDVAIGRLKNFIRSVEGQKSVFESKDKSISSLESEIHKKYTLSISVLILFFIGAPLGAIIKKGGFGTPVVFAVLLFMFYYVISISGENMVKSGFVTPFFGMWLSSIVLFPIACWITIKAVNDSKLVEIELIPKWIKKLKTKNE